MVSTDYEKKAMEIAEKAKNAWLRVFESHGQTILVPMLISAIGSLRGGFDREPNDDLAKLWNEGVQRMHDGMEMLMRAMALSVHREFPDVEFERFAADHGLILKRNEE